MLPFSSTQKGHAQIEYMFAYTLGVARTSFSMYCSTQECAGMGQVFTFAHGGVVEYCVKPERYTRIDLCSASCTFCYCLVQ